jgi:hypothetical protein
MKYAIGAIVLLLASLAMGQEIKHAPTIAQCRADLLKGGTELIRL